MSDLIFLYFLMVVCADRILCKIYKKEKVMKNAIREYLELKDEEKEELWNNAVFVFDTNVFLNLYR